MRNGGVDWSDKRVLDVNGDHKVSLKEYAQADTLINTIDRATMAYKDAVDHFGNPRFYRLYVISHAGHVDHNADGGWGANSDTVDPNIPNLLTPMQA